MNKGWCSVKPYRCGATHYVHPHDGTKSLCGRATIRITAEGVLSMDIKKQRKFANLGVCDPCQSARRRK